MLLQLDDHHQHALHVSTSSSFSYSHQHFKTHGSLRPVEPKRKKENMVDWKSCANFGNISLEIGSRGFFEKKKPFPLYQLEEDQFPEAKKWQ